MEASLQQTDPAARAERLSVLGHQGLGGSCAYADPGCRFALVVLKNVYSPEVINGGGPGLTFRRRATEQTAA